MRVHLIGLLLLMTLVAAGQQVPDTIFKPFIWKAAYQEKAGPVVQVDEAHNNFHTISNRFKPFSNLLTRDGYRVRGGKTPFSKASLPDVRILVVSNALHERNREDWSLPTPSAFTDDEIKVVEAWVKDGGSLFLIADHMPFPGCNEKLAAAFGFTFYNGFAIDSTKQGPDLFTVANKRLSDHAIIAGLDSVYSFTGQAFDIPPSAKALLTLDQNFKIWSSPIAWKFDSATTKIEGRGKAQIAMLEYGKGRVVVSGEAAMFTAQLAGKAGNRMGFNHPLAKDNPEFLLRLIHWLDRR